MRNFSFSSALVALSGVLIPFLSCPEVRASDAWPRFLGFAQNNTIDPSKRIPVEWSSEKGVRWRTEIPGEGWSSPLAESGRIWLTTATEDGLSLRAICVDFETGAIIHNVEVFHLEAPPVKHRRNSHASPTGLLSGGRFFVHFGTNGTAALDSVTGKVLWRQQGLKVDHQNGAGGSLTEFGELLLIPCDGMDVQHEVALNKATGQVVWDSERSAKAFLETLAPDRRKAYGTPFLIESKEGPVSVTTASTRLYGLDPSTGKERWFLNYGLGFSNAPLPAWDGKTLVISTGFMKPEVWGIKLDDAKGDISETHVLWKQKTAAPDQATPVIYKNLVFTISSSGIASCLDLATGDVLWRERIGSDFAATPLIANDLVYFFDCSGLTTLVKAQPSYEVVQKNTLSEGFMSSPAVVGSALVLRTKAALYRVEASQ